MAVPSKVKNTKKKKVPYPIKVIPKKIPNFLAQQ